MPSLKVVLDTNVLVSAFVFKGACGRIMDWCIEYADLYISEWILREVNRVLLEKIGLEISDAAQVTTVLSNQSAFSIVNPTSELPTVCRDADDNNILQLSESVKADYIVTGDKDLLVLEKYKHAYILSPKQFLDLVNNVAGAD